jgi:hypothetical protein
MRPDIPQYKQTLAMSNTAYDALAVRRKLHERNGWQFLPEKPVVTINADFTSVCRCRYVLADRRTLVMSHHLPTQGFKAWVAGTEVNLQYPINWVAWHQYREMYRDSALYCGNDGEAPMLLYSGTTHQGTAVVPNCTIPAGKGVVTLPSPPAANTYPSGTYLRVSQGSLGPTSGQNPAMYLRVLERVDSDISLEHVKNTAAGPTTETQGNPFGMTYPNVAVYGAGTISTLGGTATATGAKFKTGDWGHVIEITDALLIQDPATKKWAMYAIKGVPTETTLSVDCPNYTNTLYFIMRRSPFTDACVNKGSPFFAGVKQFPSRVYVGAPQTNLGLPPGWVPNTPFPITDMPQFQTTEQGAFELFSVDIPDVYGDPIVALLPVGDAVLVCKRRSFHALYGAYPDFTQRVVDDGAGCIHRGGAVATFSGVWAAGHEALYTWRDGRMFDLSFDKTSTIWHSFTRDFRPDSDWCAIGERDAHLIITLTSSAQRRKGSWFYDIRRDEWMCEITNFAPLHFFSGEQGGDSVECLAVDPEHNGQVIDAGYMVEETKPRLPDGNGLGPSFAYESTYSLAQAEQIEGETILCDVAVHARLDAPQPGKDALAVQVASHGGVRREPGRGVEYKTLAPVISSTDPQIVDRYNLRANQKGRLHSVRISRVDNKRPKGSYCELVQINLSVIDAAGDT